MVTKGRLLCFPHPPAFGGPGSFQYQFEKMIIETGWQVIYKESNLTPTVILVVGGTKSLIWLIKMKLKGVPVVYRLDGLSWLHRRKKVGLRSYFIQEIGNILRVIIHAFIADYVVYQSLFVESWWKRKGGNLKRNKTVIYNGSERISQKLQIENKSEEKRLLILEGNIDYSPYAIKLLNQLAQILPTEVKIEVYGQFEKEDSAQQLDPRVKYKGYIERSHVRSVLVGSVYLSLDINPACPNGVIEALNCACPVVAFDTGAIPELVKNDSGIVVPYGSNPWKLEYPNVPELSKAIIMCFENYGYYSQNAFQCGREKFNFKEVFNDYMAVIDNVCSAK